MKQTVTLEQTDLDELARIMQDMRHKEAMLLAGWLTRKIDAQKPKAEPMPKANGVKHAGADDEAVAARA
jgi:hypothetical protein